MNLRALALVPWMVVAGACFGQVRSASVFYTYRNAPNQQAFRLGDECFVPVDVLSTWGWRIEKRSDAVNATIEGHTVHLDTRYVGGKLTIPLRKAISEVGGDSAWTPGTDTLNVFSTLSDLSVHDLHIHAEGGLKFKATTYYLSPGKTVIDLQGVRIGNATRQDLPEGAKAIQYRPNMVRVTVDTAFIPKLPDEPAAESTEFDYAIQRDQELAEKPNPESNRVEVVAVDNNPPKQTPNPTQIVRVVPDRVQPPTPAGPPGVLSITVDSESENSSVLGLRLSNAVSGKMNFQKPDPATLEIYFPTTVQLPAANVSSATIASVESRATGSGTTVTIHLNRSMGTEFIAEPNGAVINLFKPRGGDSKLAGKLIVVDPGHGGHDSGAHDGGVNEKDLNLAIGLKLAKDLIDAGANVILTRKDDTFIPLLERSGMSNRSHADIFISCHINSAGDHQTGTITFHHKGSKISTFLAECIQDQIRRVNGLPNKGVMSDGVIYNSGFSVLRNTNAPCVLIEMGFIDNSRDRERMVTQDFQNSVANAVVKGLRVYLGEAKPNE